MVRPRHMAVCMAASGMTLLLAGCADDMIPAHRGKAARTPHMYRPIAPVPDMAQCTGTLNTLGVRYTRLPDRDHGGGCVLRGTVQLSHIGLETSNLGAMTCPLAAHFAAWARYGVQPAARAILGSPVVRIETMGTYNCRRIAGSSQLSQHAHGNAVDVATFVLADGRRISVRNGWHGAGESGQFLRTVHASACRRFRTVLGPDFNAAHRDHLHFDMGGPGGHCR